MHAVITGFSSKAAAQQLSSLKTWLMFQSATNGFAIVTRSAETGKTHYLTKIILSCSTGTLGQEVEWKVRHGAGDTEIIRNHINRGNLVIDFNPALRTPVMGDRLAVVLDPCGTGIEGRVSVQGFTLP